jgi:hypothetical protein
VADDAVDALEGVDLLLYRDLVVGPRFEAAADADVDPLGVLAEDHEVDVVPGAVLQGAQALIEQSNRPVVDVQIQLEAGAEQDVAGVAIVGYARIAQGADEDRVA